MADTPMVAAHHVRLGSNSGQPMTRRDGIAKVTGTATYAADNHPEDLLHAVFAGASIARGRVTSLDIEAALAHPGVVHVMTPANTPALSQDPDHKTTPFTARIDVLQNDKVRYAGQPIAVVLAETLEAAVEGARLVKATYETDQARIGFDDGEAFAPEAVGISTPPKFSTGDFEGNRKKATQSASVEMDTPLQYHNAMETHAVVAEWDGDHVTVDMPNQAIGLAKPGIANYFGIPPENVKLRSPYLGGGFGSKAVLFGPQMLGILAAREMKRPVKLALKRDQMFGPVQHRSATRQSVRYDMDAKNRFLAFEHTANVSTSSFDNWLDGAANAGLSLYATPSISVSHSGTRFDTGTPGAMRAPGIATGSAVIECAIDVAAEKAGMDPLEFRLLNYAEKDPSNGKPYSAKALRECYKAAADSFGWEDRPLKPRQMRDENGLLTGWGMGTSIFHAPFFPAKARAVLRQDGSARAETSGADMGQGAWTVLWQMAADGLGMAADDIEFDIGHSDLPDGSVAGGSAHTASAGGALFAAGNDVIRQLAEIATQDKDSPLFGAGNERVLGENGRLFKAEDPNVGESYTDILQRAGIEEIEGKGRGNRDKASTETYAMFSHGAVFAEVKVDPDLFQVRVTRLVGAFAAGRIINPRLAQSQLTGGMIWGVGFALHEEGIHDKRSGRPLNNDFAGYHIPVLADVPHLKALLVDEEDPHVNDLGVKGVGELGITGTVGAIANAVWHATGVRTARYPIKIEDLLKGAQTLEA
ncbi:xanthine dehydrogenase family protein molybdopterin-binding subunit [Henriciella marina]|uniref:xanthine dehydrogenase family protein molybdopterin-binding subunit n=1 Tax=Henriciella marina TaxID=453851 RepID=UPI000382D8B2|nr:xanthine dehydrogenase family protein molybdopterin-binding subunit [Henriciella marina]